MNLAQLGKDGSASSLSSISTNSHGVFETNRAPDRLDVQEADRLLHGYDDSEPAATALDSAQTETAVENDDPVTWRSLPRKGQLCLLMLGRVSEPLTQTSLQSYMYYMIKSFDLSQPDSMVATKVGWMQASFTLAQFLTAFLWGRLADSPRVGRKRVLVMGLLGTMLSAIGFGFSRSFAMAMFFRSMGGALNGNVGVMRTMISETIREKKFQGRAFMLLPMTANVAVIIGPSIGGFLAEPVTSHPQLFGKDSIFGGKDGVRWLSTFPYALPNIVSGIILGIAFLSLLFGLEETHHSRKHKRDPFREFSKRIGRCVSQRRSSHEYSAIANDDTIHSALSDENIELRNSSTFSHRKSDEKRRKLPFRRIWTRNVVLTLLTHGLLAFHVGTFNNIWFIFMSTPRFDSSHPDPPSTKERHLPFRFTGGFAMTPSKIGLSLSVIGIIGITLQLLIYPRMQARYGTIKCYRFALALFPITYFLAPYLSLLPSTTGPETSASGPTIWAGICGLLFIQVLARTFALPGTAILVNNCCPHPSVLGAIHGLGQSVSSGTRTLGPLIGGYLFGKGMTIGMIGLPWWAFCIEALGGALSALFIREGSGHEIFLEGEQQEVAT